MGKIQKEGIKEIARAIALGKTCYIQRYSAKITTIDHSEEDSTLLPTQEKMLTEFEKKPDDYVKIINLSTQEQKVIMKDFLQELPDKSVQKQLANALNRKNPVRNFTQVIESDMALNIHWENFNFEEYQRCVSNMIIDAYNY